jgi:hypothetical protein
MTDSKYLQGKKTTNYVCYPGGGSYVRWDATKEVTFVWTDRLMPAEDGNEIDEIEHRTDLIEAQVSMPIRATKFRLPSPFCHITATKHFTELPSFLSRHVTGLGHSGRRDSPQSAKAEPAAREIRSHPARQGDAGTHPRASRAHQSLFERGDCGKDEDSRRRYFRNDGKSACQKAWHLACQVTRIGSTRMVIESQQSVTLESCTRMYINNMNGSLLQRTSA